MSDKKPAPAKPAGKPPTARRISQPRPKKSTASPETTDLPPASGVPDLTESPAPPAAAATEEPPTISNDWPEPESATSGGKPQDGKRKRRRRKGKGQANQAHAAAGEPLPQDADDADEAVPAVVSVAAEAPRPARAPQPQPPPRQHQPRTKVDPEILARKAWKIFLAEVSEEGVALIGDQDARELARRCFRLAETFLEEQTRRLSGS